MDGRRCFKIHYMAVVRNLTVSKIDVFLSFCRLREPKHSIRHTNAERWRLTVEKTLIFVESSLRTLKYVQSYSPLDQFTVFHAFAEWNIKMENVIQHPRPLGHCPLDGFYSSGFIYWFFADSSHSTLRAIACESSGMPLFSRYRILAFVLFYARACSHCFDEWRCISWDSCVSCQFILR